MPFALRAVATVILVLSPFGVFTQSSAQTHSTAVGLEDAHRLRLETGTSRILAIAPLPDGGAYVGGDFSRIAGRDESVSLVRLRPDGSIDEAFRSFDTGLVDGSVNALLVQEDGKLVVGGHFEQAGGRENLVRLHVDGSLDLTFATKGVSGLVHDLVETVDGRILVVGEFSSYLAVDDEFERVSNLVLIEPDGLRDRSFASPGTSDSVWAALATADGGFLIGGEFHSVGDVALGALAKLSSDGSIDVDFGAGGGFTPRAGRTVYALARDADGAILVGGDFFDYAGESAVELMRIDEEGIRDDAFSNAFRRIGGTVHAIQLDAAGDIWAGLGNRTGGRAFLSGVVQLDSTGHFVENGQPDGPQVMDSVLALAIGAAGELWVGGQGIVDRADGLLRISTDSGAVLPGFLPALRGAGAVRTAITTEDDAVWLGGVFHYINGERTDNAAKIGPDGSVVERVDLALGSWDQDQAVNALLDDRAGGVYLGGRLYGDPTVPGAARSLVHWRADGTLDPDFAGSRSSEHFVEDPSNTIWNLAWSSDGRVMVQGDFTRFGGAGRSRVARMEPDGRLDPSFDPGTTGLLYVNAVRAMVVDTQNRVYLGGRFDRYAGSARSNLVRLTSEGVLDTSFPDLEISSQVNDMRWGADGRLLIAGGFTTVGGVYSPQFARVSTDGSVDTGFGDHRYPLWGATQILEQADGRIVVGGSLEFSLDDYLLRYESDGAQDPTFAALNINGRVDALAAFADGSLVVGGDAMLSVRSGLLTPASAPTISTQPIAQTGEAGGSVTFEVVVEGAAPLRVRWYHDGVLLAASDSALLTLSNLTFEDLGEYYAEISNPLGTVTSNVVTLNSPDAVPVISVQPQTVSVGVGQPAVLAVEVAGNDVEYQWRRDGLAIAGANAASLVVAHSSLSDAGRYDVVVTRGLGHVVSNAVRLVVEPPPGPAALGSEAVEPVLLAKLRSEVHVIIPLPDGGAYIGGEFHAVNGVSTGPLARLKSDGSVDTSFESAISRALRVYGMVLQEDGKLVVAESDVVRLNSDGTIDPSFEEAGFSSTVYSLAPGLDGRLLVAGAFSTYYDEDSNAFPCDGFVVLNRDGSRDESFTPAVFDGGHPKVAVALADGGYLVGGEFNSVNGEPHGGLVHLNSDGSIASGFGAGNSGFWGYPKVHDIRVTADGTIWVAGALSRYGEVDVSHLVRLSVDGQLDTAFSENLGDLDGEVTALAIEQDGSLLAVGAFTRVQGEARRHLVRLQADGRLGQALPDGVMSKSEGIPGSVAVSTGGAIWVGAESQQVDDWSVARLHPATGASDGFAPLQTIKRAELSASLLMPNNELLLGGNFEAAQGVATDGLVRIHRDGTVKQTYELGLLPYGVQSIDALVRLGDGSVVVGGEFRTNGFVLGVGDYLFRLLPDGSLDTQFGTAVGVLGDEPVLNGKVTDLAVGPDGSILATGKFTRFGGNMWSNVAKFDARGRPDEGFSPPESFSSGYYSDGTVAVDDQGRVYLSGRYQDGDGVLQSGVARLLADGSLDPSYKLVGMYSRVTDMLIDSADRLVVVGSFTSAPGGAADHIARFLPDGSRDVSFGNHGGLGYTPAQVTELPGGKLLVAGSFTATAGASSSPYLVQINPDGTRDETFRAIDLLGPLTTAALFDDGSLFVGGGVWSTNGFPQAVYAPRIVEQPLSTAVGAGDAVSFSVIAEGSAPLSYQWYHGVVALEGATTSSLVIEQVRLADLGVYHVEVSNLVGSAQSEAAELASSDAAPDILTDPTDLVVTVGETATFAVTVEPEDVNYQWRVNGFPIVGATGSRLTVEPASLALAGLYDVEVISGVSRVVSEPARLTVHPASYPEKVLFDPTRDLGLEGPNGQVRAFASLPDGRFYVAGYFSFADHIRRSSIVRLLADGSVDPTFDRLPTWMVGATVRAIAVQPDGKILVGGIFNGSGKPSNFLRLNSDGSLDELFANRGFNGQVWSVDVATDGRILVGGHFTEHYTADDGSEPCLRVALLDTDGVRITGFDPEPDDRVTTVRFLRGAGYLISGSFDHLGEVAAPGIARFEANGSFDAAFAARAGFVDHPNWHARVFAEDVGGAILIGGYLEAEAGANLHRVAADGTPDDTFAANANTAGISVTDIVPVPGGGFWLAGINIVSGSSSNVVLRRLSADGTTVAAFEDGGWTQDPVVLGPLVSSGTWFGYIAQGNLPAVRLADLGSGESGVAGPGLADSASIIAAVPMSGNRTIIGGNFVRAGGQPASGLAIIASNGLVESVPDIGGAASIYLTSMLQQGNGEVLVGGHFREADGLPGGSSNLVRIHPDGNLDQEFAETYSENVYSSLAGTVRAIAHGSDGFFYVAGSFSSGDARNSVLRLFSDGRRDAGFEIDLDPYSSFPPEYLDVDREGRIYVSGQYFGLRRFFADGSEDPSLAVPQYSGVLCMAVDAEDRLLVGGWFSSVNGVAVPSNVVRFNSDGTLDLDFAETAAIGAVPYDLQVQPDGTILVSGNIYRNYRHTVRLLPDGQIDTTFGHAGLVGGVELVRLRDDGNLFIGGTLPGMTVPAVAPQLRVGLSDQTVDPGQSLVLSVEATGSGDLEYKWYHDGELIEGATGPTLVVPDFGPADAGAYRTVVSSFVGEVESLADVSWTAGPVVMAEHVWMEFDGDPTDQASFTIANHLAWEGEVDEISWTVVVPTGWSLEANADSGAVVVPPTGSRDLAEWVWTSPGVGPLEFEYLLIPDQGVKGRFELASLVDAVADEKTTESMADPDPLYLRRLGRGVHNADLDGDMRIGLAELLRVIELYNTRSGTTRTGRYRVLYGSEDMFSPDHATVAGSLAGGSRIHSADYDHDGALSLSELLRVIELYNTRSGTQRTGAYHPAEGTDDGFAPGM